MKIRFWSVVPVLAVVLSVSLAWSIHYLKSVGPRKGYTSTEYEGVLTTEAGTYRVLIIESSGSVSLHEGITVVLSNIAYRNAAIDGFANSGDPWSWNSVAYCGDYPNASRDTWGAGCNRMSIGPQGWYHETPFTMAGPPARMDLAYPGKKNEPLSQKEIDFITHELDAARALFNEKYVTRHWDDKLGLIEKTSQHPSP